MEIKRKFEMRVETNRRYVIRQSSSGKPTYCSECGELMVTIEQAAVFFGIKQRRIFRIIETGAVHFAEISAAMICLKSLTLFLDADERK